MPPAELRVRQAVGVRWVGYVLFAGWSLFVASLLRDGWRVWRISRARQALRFDEVLGLPWPRRQWIRSVVLVPVAETECIVGRYQRCLDLLEEARRDRSVRRQLRKAGEPNRHQLISLLGLGRYREVLDATASPPLPPMTPHLRAQAAIELGLDDLALEALAEEDETELLRAGNQRIRGDLLIRRGRLEEGRRHVETAMAYYASSAEVGVEVDRGYCLHHLAEAAHAAGDLAAATRFVEQAVTAIRSAPTNAPGIAIAHLVACRIAAASGDLEAAREHLTKGVDAVRSCDDPMPLVAEQSWSEGDLAAGAGDRAGAVDGYRRAVELYRSMGADPAATTVARRLDELG